MFLQFFLDFPFYNTKIRAVRNLPSVETLGCISVIATDKTGTLTTNQMTVVTLVTFEKEGEDVSMVEHAVEGVSYKPFGKVQSVEYGEVEKIPTGAVADIIAVSFGCNDAKLVDYEGEFIIRGEPTEGALLTLAEKLCKQQVSSEVHRDRIAWENEWKRYATLDFDRKRKSMGVLCRQTGTGMERLLVKGAPGVLLKRCSHVKNRNGEVIELTSEMREKFQLIISSLSSRPLRCLLLAVKEVFPNQFEHLINKEDNFIDIETDLTAVALIGIKDPARPDASKSIDLCKQAGIRVVMITGDDKGTAVAIAQELDILSEDSNSESKAFDGKEFFFSKSEEEQRSILSEGNLVLSRTEATDKQRIVKMMQSCGEVLAMTGDGVNDAPALRQANIGMYIGDFIMNVSLCISYSFSFFFIDRYCHGIWNRRRKGSIRYDSC